MAKYDVFISYRRTSFDTANLIAEKLRNAGYKVFFDVDTLTAGKFNEQLLEVINECKDFVLILPEKALDRCTDENDWVRRETICAIETGKNIIPVMLDGFSWPNEMPEGLEELPNYQAITAINREYFDMSVSRLKGYLKSKPSKPLKKWMAKTAIILGVILVLVGIGMLVFRHVANVACEEIAAKQTSVMEAVDELSDLRKMLEENATNFFAAIDKCDDDVQQEYLIEDFFLVLNKVEEEASNIQRQFPAPKFELGTIERFVLARYGVKQAELDAFSTYYLTIFDNVNNSVRKLRSLIETGDDSSYDRAVALLDIQIMKHDVNVFYYGYLANISLLPKSSRTVYYEAAKKWKNFPNGTPLDLSQEEYDNFQTTEMNIMFEEVAKVQKMINYENDQLDEMDKKLDDLLQEVQEDKENR